uniref:Uncharacterized protein n=1 Tax=Romanomermis culicivorax TaxID=13658 RepID=A0A915KLW1_ROMCU
MSTRQRFLTHFHDSIQFPLFTFLDTEKHSGYKENACENCWKNNGDGNVESFRLPITLIVVVRDVTPVKLEIRWSSG